MATLVAIRGEHEEPGENSRPSTWYFLARYAEVLDASEMRDKFIDLLKSREDYRTASLPSVDIVTFSLPQAVQSETSIKGFIHGHKIRQNAVLGYFVDPASDDINWKVQWQPIPGYYWRHEFQTFLIANLLEAI